MGKIQCVFSVCFLMAGAVQAAVITWETPVAVADETDVVTDGTLVEAINLCGSAIAENPVANGVQFVATSDKLDLNTDGTAFCTSVPTGPYDDLLSTLDWGDQATTGDDYLIAAPGLLEVGKNYLVQIWYVDDRAAPEARTMQFAGTSDFAGQSDLLNDQYVIGYFTADSTSQQIWIDAANGTEDPHVNAYQIRELASGPVPILSTAAGDPVSGNFTVAIDFTEVVRGLAESDISVVNGTVMASSISGSGANWSVVIVPTANGDVSVTLPADSVIDVAREPNPESNTLVTTYVSPGSDQPMVTLSTPLAEVSRDFAVQINFTEDVTGLELGDFLITNGTLSGLSGSGASYSMVVTPLSAGDVTVSLPRNAVTDTDGDNLQNPASNELVRSYSGVQSKVLYRDHFDSDSLAVNTGGVGGGAINRTIQAHAWTDDGDATFVANGTSDTQRALLYSENTFQSDTGFRLTVKYTTGSIGDVEAHNLSFGLISSDTDLSTYTGYNPFLAGRGVYGIGANVTADAGTAARGLNFTDGSTPTTLDESGTRAQFVAGESTEVTIEIGMGGYWCYRIDGDYEASDVLLEGFDLTEDYHVVVYGQDDAGGGKSIQSLNLEAAYAAGERAAGMRGNWNGGEGDLESVKDFKTLDSMGMNFSDGATLSAQHYAPHKLLETIALLGVDGTGPPIEFVVAPSWGDLRLDEPEHDAFLERILEIRAAGFKVKAYSNCENFVGSNQTYLQQFVDRWIEYCDTDPEVQAFINSQPFHTGVWNRTNQQYEDASATYPHRKYMFCYAECVLKDYSLRYGKYLGSWIFDSSTDITQNGDNATSGLIEEQRIFQAFANAVHAGNPNVPIAFNNGRSTVNYASYPFAHAVRFDDFTFGHAFGGNNNHAEKVDGNQFNLNYQHITRMVETDGYVHDGGNWEWDDLIVGNFHSKLSTTAWKYGTVQAWEEAVFFQWNLEAMHAGGHMTWNGSIWRSDPTLQSWAFALLQGLDDHLAQYESPGAPDWARAYTPLEDAVIGMPYAHTLVDDVDFWDPEGDAVTLSLGAGAPSWLTVEEDALSPGSWLLQGVPTETTATAYEFGLLAADASGATERWVQLTVNEATFPSYAVRSINGGATWTESPLSGDIVYDSSGTHYLNRALVYSADTYQSSGGFRLTVWYTTGTVEDNLAHQLSFGLISTDTDLTTYDAYNPFGSTQWDTTTPIVYSLGATVVAAEEHGSVQGLNFTDGRSRVNLDLPGDHVQFMAGASTPVVIEIGPGGTWSYTLNGIEEASGVIPTGFDLTKRYHIAVYGQDDNGGGKSIQSMALELLDAPGSYAAWVSGYALTVDDAQPEADVENGGIGDGYSNFAEYALGMNPTISDAGSRESVGTAAEGGTNYFEYVHYRRSDYVEQGLNYLLIDSTNLVDSVVHTNTQDQILVGQVVDGYEPATNRYLSDDPVMFLELNIQQNQDGW